jgi:hypothetical protein
MAQAGLLTLVVGVVVHQVMAEQQLGVRVGLVL